MNHRQESSRTRTMSVVTILPFLVLTFGITWGLALLIVLFPQQIVDIFGEINYSNPLYIVAVYAPAIAAIVLILHYYGMRGFVSFLRRITLWRMSFSWWIFIVLGVPALFYLAAAFSGNIGDPFPFVPWYSVLPAALFMLVLGPVEEFGWRGLALSLLQRRFAPLWSGLIIGIVWGLWHLPSFFIGETPHSEWVFAQFFVGTMALSVIMTAMFNASKGSILTVALLHFQLNNPIWPDGQPWDMVVFSVAAVVIVLFNRRSMLSSSHAVTSIFMPEEGEEGEE